VDAEWNDSFIESAGCLNDLMGKVNLVSKLGRNWNNGSNASSFYRNVNNTASNRNRNIRGRLLFVHNYH